jgi:glutamyl-tRNA reductase
MHLLTLGLNHTTAPIALRERVAFPGERMRDALGDLRRRLAALVPESAIFSTCNRTEAYCAVREPAAAHRALVDWLAAGSALPARDLHCCLYAPPPRCRAPWAALMRAAPRNRGPWGLRSPVERGMHSAHDR